MKKKILIVSHCMRLGGVERSLLGLLDNFNFDEYEIDLFLFLHDGELLSQIPTQVNLLPEKKRYTSLMLPLKKILFYGYFDILFLKLSAYIKAHFFLKRNKINSENLVYPVYLQKYISKVLPKINDVQYDLAISFLTPHYIVSQKTNSKKNIAWIHTDYSYFKLDRSAELKMWNEFNYIASISEDCSKVFEEVFPELKSKIILIENVLTKELILKQSISNDIDPRFVKDKNTFILCTVGRFSAQKNFDNIPMICKKIIDSGCNIKWYLIGYGGYEEEIKKNIIETKMEHNVIILGKQTNPYPYIKGCDIYVQPSRYEGKAVTVREAQILAKPVVITDFTTSATQLHNGFDGVIVPLDNVACALGIKSLIENAELQSKLIQNCLANDFTNSDEIMKIYALTD